MHKVLDKCWYIDDDSRYPALVVGVFDDKPYLEVMVFYGGLWEKVFSPQNKLRIRKEDWAEKMFDFRKQTVQLENINWEI